MERLSYFGILWRCVLIFIGTSLGVWALVLVGSALTEDAFPKLAMFATGYMILTVCVFCPVMAWSLRYSTSQVAAKSMGTAAECLGQLLEGMGYCLDDGKQGLSTFVLARGFGPWRWPIHISEENGSVTVTGPSATVWMLLRRFRAAENTR